MVIHERWEILPHYSALNTQNICMAVLCEVSEQFISHG